MPALDGKVAIVTGGAQGIGNAIAHGLAAEGARVVIADLRGAEEAAGGLPDGVGLAADVAVEEDVSRLVAETVQRCGPIDVLVNNAGLYASLAMRPFEQIPLDEWRRVMDVSSGPTRYRSASASSSSQSRSAWRSAISVDSDWRASTFTRAGTPERVDSG